MRTRYLIALALATLARQVERLPLTPEEKALLAGRPGKSGSGTSWTPDRCPTLDAPQDSPNT